MKNNEDILNIDKNFMVRVVSHTDLDISSLDPYLSDNEEYDIDCDKMLKDESFMASVTEPFAIEVRHELDRLKKVHAEMDRDDVEDAWDVIERQMSFFPLAVKRHITRLTVAKSNIPNNIIFV